jgi:phosphoribosylanthranilate isomerase
MQVKICGVTTPEAARAAAAGGASAVGFVFAASPRRVTPEQATRLAAGLPPGIATVAVFRHPTRQELDEVLGRFPADMIQVEPGPVVQSALSAGVQLLPVLHDGRELLERLASLSREHPSGVLLEAAGRGGRGIRPDWTRAARLARSVPLVLAGGLTPENVTRAIRQVRPAAVDVSSGVESRPGQKDPGLIREFIRRATAADSQIGPRTGAGPLPFHLLNRSR